MKHAILKWLSKWLPITIPAGQGISTLAVDRKVETTTVVPDTGGFVPKEGMPRFFKPNKKLTAFEYIGTKDNQHILECMETGVQIVLETKAFLTLFTGVQVNVKYGKFNKDQTK